MKIKYADSPTQQETDFESAFASLAYTYIKDRCPRFLNYLVGFQLLEKNDDNTKAVGIFGAYAKPVWMYNPVFFNNGNLNGKELLYIKNSDIFVPLKDNWVNFITLRKEYTLGEPTNKQINELGAMTPNLYRLQYPPLGIGKFSSDKGVPYVREWLKPLLPMVGATAIFSEKIFEKHAHLKDKLDLRNIITNLPRAQFVFDKLYTKYPLIKKGFDTFYGKDFFVKLAKNLKYAQSNIIPVRKKKPVKITLEAGKLPLHGPNNNVQYIYFRTVSVSTRLDDSEKDWLTGNFYPILMDFGGNISYEELSDKEKEQLLKDTFMVRDRRHPEEVSELYDVKSKKELANPDETGFYDVLVENGKFKNLLVILHPHSGLGPTPTTLVYDPESKKVVVTRNTDIWTKQCHCPNREELREFCEKLDEVGEKPLQVGKIYILLCSNGKATLPFLVVEKLDDDLYIINMCEYNLSKLYDRPLRSSPVTKSTYLYTRKQDPHCPCFQNEYVLKITPREGMQIRSDDKTLYVPKSFYIAEVKSSLEETTYLLSPLAPAALADIELELQNSLSKISAHYLGGNQYQIESKNESKTLDKVAAVLYLVNEHHLRVDDAKGILKQAEEQKNKGKKIEYYIKYPIRYLQKQAQPANLLTPGPTAPPIDTLMVPPTPIDIAGGRKTVNAIPPQEAALPIDSLSAYNTDPAIYDPFALPDPRFVQIAQEAAQKGQKEIFDTAILAGMLKSVYHDDLIDKYIDDILLAIDKIGRILFMLFWHRETFAERYGKHDIPEMEASLKNTFEALGDLYLFLKEKSTGGLNIGISNLYSKRDEGPSLDRLGKDS